MYPTSLHLCSKPYTSSPTRPPSSDRAPTVIDALVACTDVDWIKNNQRLIFVGDNVENYQLFAHAINRMCSTQLGAQLLEAIATAAQLKSEKLIVRLDADAIGVVAHDETNAKNQRGTGSTLLCNFSSIEYRRDKHIKQEEFHAAVLFHEMVHVLNNLNGAQFTLNHPQGVVRCYAPAMLEEARAVGLGRFSQHAFSENRFRQAIDLPRRAVYQFGRYFTINDDDTVTVALDGIETYSLSQFKL